VSDEQQDRSIVIPDELERRALLEAIIYVAEEPLTLEQIALGLELPIDIVRTDLDALTAETAQPGRGIEVRAVAGGYKISTKAQHHEAVRKFVKTLRPKLKLSLPALETLAVIAYKQPVTLPEVQAVRGVNASATIHTLLNHKLVTTAGRKQVIGKPIQYKTTKEFLVQFGLNDLAELPNLKELEELSRAALGEGVEEQLPLEGAEAAAAVAEGAGEVPESAEIPDAEVASGEVAEGEAAEAEEGPESGEWPEGDEEEEAEVLANSDAAESEESAEEQAAEGLEDAAAPASPRQENGRESENDESETEAEVVGRG
jgi:segregation and condensation protein B